MVWHTLDNLLDDGAPTRAINRRIDDVAGQLCVRFLFQILVTLETLALLLIPGIPGAALDRHILRVIAHTKGRNLGLYRVDEIVLQLFVYRVKPIPDHR